MVFFSINSNSLSKLRDGLEKIKHPDESEKVKGIGIIDTAIGGFESAMTQSSIAVNQLKRTIIGKEIEILKARYYEKDHPENSKDITSTISSLIDNMRFSFNVNIADLGIDPFYGKKKCLEIEYIYHNKKYLRSFDDYSIVSLP